MLLLGQAQRRDDGRPRLRVERDDVEDAVAQRPARGASGSGAGITGRVSQAPARVSGRGIHGLAHRSHSPITPSSEPTTAIRSAM